MSRNTQVKSENVSKVNVTRKIILLDWKCQKSRDNMEIIFKNARIQTMMFYSHVKNSLHSHGIFIGINLFLLLFCNLMI